MCARRTGRTLFGALLVLACTTGAALAQQTRYVDPTGTDSGDCLSSGSPCQTIGYAVDQAAVFDTVDIAAGTYTEQVVVNKSLTLQGEEGAVIQAPATVDGFTIPEHGSTWEPVVFGFGGTASAGDITGSGVISLDIHDLTIDGNDRVTSGNDDRATGILLRNVSGEISGNTVENMYQPIAPEPGRQTIGIAAYGNSSVQVLNNDVSGYSRMGIGIQGDNGPLTDPNGLISGNTVTGPGYGTEDLIWAPNGVQVTFGATGSVIGNTITGNYYFDPDDETPDTPGGVVVIGEDNILVQNNDLTGNSSGIQVSNADGTQILGNTIDDGDYGILSYPGSSDTVIDGNGMSGNQVGILVYGGAGSPNEDTTFTNNTVDGSELAVWIEGDTTSIMGLMLTSNDFEDNEAQLDADPNVLTGQDFAADNTFDITVTLDITPGLPAGLSETPGWDHFTASLSSDAGIPENVVLWTGVAGIDDADVANDGLEIEYYDPDAMVWRGYGWGGGDGWQVGRDAWFIGRDVDDIIGIEVTGGETQDIPIRINWPNGEYTATTTLESLRADNDYSQPGERIYFDQTDELVIASNPPDMSLDITAGLPGGMEEPGWSGFTAQLTNNGGEVPENVVLWTEVTGIDDADVAGGLDLQFFDGSDWRAYGWGGASSWIVNRDAWFIGRDVNEITGFPIPATYDETLYVRANWPDGSYDITTTLESTDSGDGSGQPGDRIYLDHDDTFDIEQFVPASLDIAPAERDFGPVGILDSASASLTVSNQGSTSSSLTLGGIAINGADAGAYNISGGDCSNGAVLAGGDTCGVQVTFTPGAIGTFGDATLDVDSDANNAGAGLTGQGEPPDWSETFDGAFDRSWTFFEFTGAMPLGMPDTAMIDGDYLRITDPDALYAGGYVERTFGQSRVSALVNADGTNSGVGMDNQIDQGVLAHFDPATLSGYTAYMSMELDAQELILAKFDQANLDPPVFEEDVTVSESDDLNWSMDRMYVVELDVVDTGGGSARIVARAFDADTGALLATVDTIDAAPYADGYAGLTAITNSTGLNGTFDTASAVSSFASADLSDDLIDFGAVEATTTSSPTTVTVTNNGNDTLNVSDISVTGADAAQFNLQNSTCSSPVAPGDTCTFETVFAPAGAGSRTAEVVIQSNASTSPDVIVLEGQALAEAMVDVSLAGLSGSYYQGDAQNGGEQAQFTFSDPDGTGSIQQIFNVFVLLDDLGNPITDMTYDDLYVSFASDPVDYIRGLSGTSPANVVMPQTIDVDLLFQLEPDAPTGTYTAVLTSYDVTGVAEEDVSLDDALAGDYPELDTASSGPITIQDAAGQITGSVGVLGAAGPPATVGDGVTVTADRGDGYTVQTTASGGSYALTGVQAGDYTVTASQDGFTMDSALVTLTGGNDTAAGVNLELDSAVTGAFSSTVGGTSVTMQSFEAGEVLNDTDLTFSRTDTGPSAPFYVSLEVYDEDGNAINYLLPENGIFTQSTLNNLDIGPGSTFNVAGGNSVNILDGVTVELGPNADRAASFEYSLIDARYPTDSDRINHQSTTLALDIQPVGEISGQVEVNGIEGGPQPAEGGEFTIEAVLDGDTVVWMVTEPDGSYLLEGLSAGTYDVQVTAQAGFADDSAEVTLESSTDTASQDFSLASAVAGAFTSTVGGVSVTDQTFEAGEVLTNTDLTFNRTDTGPAATFYVSLEVYDDDGSAINYVLPENGIFTQSTLDNLDIGPGNTFSVAGGNSVDILDGVTVELGPNADQAASFEYSLIDSRYPTGSGRINHRSTTLGLDIQPVGEISGNVDLGASLGPDLPAEGYQVTASRDGDEVASDTTDGDGDYLLEGLAAGTYDLEVEAIDGFTAGDAQVTLDTSTDTVVQDFDLDGTVTGAFTATAGGTSIAGRSFPAGREIDDVDLSFTRDDGGAPVDFYVSLTVLDSGGNPVDYINQGLFSPSTLAALDGVLGEDGTFTLGGSATETLLSGATLELGEDADALDVATLSFRLVDARFGDTSGRIVHVAGDYALTVDPADTLAVTLAGFNADYEQGESQSGGEQVSFTYSEGAGDVEQVFNVFTVLEGGVEIDPSEYDAIFESVAFNPNQIRGLSGTDPSVVTDPDDLSTVDVSFMLEDDAPLGDYELVITSFDVTGIDPGDVSIDDTGSYRDLATASQDVSLIEGPVLELTIDGPPVVQLADQAYYDVRLQNTGDAPTDENVEVQFTLDRPGIAVGDVVLDYCTDMSATSGPSCSSWAPLTLTQDNGSLSGTFGPGGGFPVAVDYDETTFIRAAFTTPGNYMVTDEVVGIDTGDILATATASIAVSELALDTESGVPDGVPDDDSGWDYFTSTLVNLGDALPEPVAVWVTVDGIDDAAWNDGAAIQYWNGDDWVDYGWAGQSSPLYGGFDRDAFFLGRPDSPTGMIEGFDIGAAGTPEGEFVTPVRVNFDNDTWAFTTSVESVDWNQSGPYPGMGAVDVYGLFDDQVVVESDPVELDLTTVPGVPGGIPQDAGWDYFTSTLTNTGGDVPENVLLWVAVDGIDDALKDGAGLEIEYWTGSAWSPLGWGGPSSFNYGFIDRDAWFLGRDGMGGISGFPIPSGHNEQVPLRLNFPDGEYTFNTTIESLDSAEAGAVAGERIYLDLTEMRNVTLDVAQPAVTPDPLDFDEVRVGTTDSAQFTVANTGEPFTSLDLDAIALTGDAAFSLAGGTCSAGATLAGGDSCTVAVDFQPGATGPFSGAVEVDSTAGDAGAGLAGEGVQPALDIAPAQLDFGPVAVNYTGGPLTATLTNTGSDELSINAIDGVSAPFAETGNTCGATLAVGASCELSYTFSPSATGNFAQSVIVSSDAPDSPAAFSVVGTGVAPEVTLDTGMLDFSDVPTGATSAPQTVMLTNTGSTPLTLGGLGLTGAHMTDYAFTGDTCSGDILGAGSSCTFSIEFSPGALGTRTATVEIPSDAPTSPDTVDLTGQGVEPAALAVSPADHDFDGVISGEQADFGFTLSNTGNAVTSLTLSDLTVTGGAFSLAGGTCSVGTTLAGGESCTATVRFAPGSVSLFSGQFAADSDAGNITAPLAGEGLSPAELAITPAAFDFGSVLVTETATTTFTLENLGDATSNLQLDAPALFGDAAFAISGGDCSGGTELAGGETCTVEVEFAPDDVGVVGATLEVDSDGGNVSADLDGEGIQPEITITPEVLDFGNVQVGSTPPVETVTLANSGTADLEITAISTLPGGSEFNAEGGSCSPPITLMPGEECTLDYSFAPTASGMITAAVTITSDAAAGPDSFSLEGTGVGDIDLGLSGQVSPDPVLAGNTVTYTLIVDNPAPVAATGVTVTSMPSTEVTFVNSSGCDESPGGGATTCTIGSVPAEDSVQVTLIYAVDGSFTGQLDFSAEVAGAQDDPEPGNDSVTLPVQVAAEADLLTVIGGEEFVGEGETVMYLLSVDNLGPSDALVVDVESLVPAGLDVLDWNCTGEDDGVCGSATGSGDIDEVVTLPADGRVTFEITAELIDAGPDEEVTVEASAAPQSPVTDPVPGDASDTLVIRAGIFADGFEGEAP